MSAEVRIATGKPFWRWAVAPRDGTGIPGIAFYRRRNAVAFAAEVREALPMLPAPRLLRKAGWFRVVEVPYEEVAVMPDQTCTCDGAPFVGPAEHAWPCPLQRTSRQLDAAMQDHYEDQARAADSEFEAGPSRLMEAMRDA